MNIGERIKERRKDLNMSVEELASKLGKNRATVYRYEKGDIHNLPIDILEPLAIALKTSPQYLMGWSEIAETSAAQKVIAARFKKWNSEFKPGVFTDDEFEKLSDYARFLISQRNKK